GTAQPILSRDVDQLIVRYAAPEEERQPRSELEIGNFVRLTVRHIRRHAFGADQELRARQETPQREFDTVFETPQLPAFLIKVRQRLEVLRARWTPVGAARKGRQDLLRAPLFLSSSGRMAGEDLPKTLRVFRTLRTEWPGDSKESNDRIILQLGDGVVVERLPLKFLHDIEAGAIVRLEKRHADDVRAGFDRNRDIDRAVVFALHALGQSDADVVQQFHPFAIDEKFELFTRHVGADAEILNGEFVLSIGREVMVNQHSAARAERQSFNVVGLADIAGRDVAGFGRRLPVADGH